MTNESLFNAGASGQIIPEADTARHAVAALRGYAYQVLATTLAWIDIDEESRLFLEVAEDYALVANQALTAAQIKDTAASGPVTLNTQSVRDAVASFVDLVDRNPQLKVVLRFFTTSEIGNERAVVDRPQGIAGLEYWKKAASGADVSPLRTLLESERFSDSVRAFVKARDDASLRRDLIGRIRWDCGRPDLDTIRLELEQRMIVLGRDRFHLPASEAPQLADLLAFRVLRKCTATDINDRILTRAELYSAIDVASQTTVPRTAVELLSRLAAANMASAGGDAAIVNPPYITEPGWFLSGSALPIPKGLLDRAKIRSKIFSALDKFGVSVLVGGSGIGKSTLSRSAARARDKEFFLVDLRNTEPFETRNRLNWLFARLAGLPFSMLILEDINCLEDKQAALSLARVIETARRHGHEMLISCYRAPPAATLVDVGLTQECVVECTYLSKNETRKLVQGHGGDPRVWGNIAYIAGGNGHAQLVHAFVLGRAASGWPIENWEDLLRDVLSNSDVDGARFAARRYLISALPDDARQLLYRLSLVVGHFSRSLALSIGDVGPSLPNVGECIDQLVGPWIETLGNDSFRVSPLAANFGRDNLALDHQRRIHSAIAAQMLGGRRIDASDIDLVVVHGLIGKSARSLAVAAHCVLTADHGDLEQYADYLPVFRLLRTDQPIFPEDRAISAVLRIAQFRLISACEHRDKLPAVVDAVFWEVGRIEEDELRTATEGMVVATVLATMGIANYLDNWLALLLKIRSMLQEGEALRGFLAYTEEQYGKVESDVPSELFCIGSSNIDNVARLEYIIDELDRVAPCYRSLLLSKTENEFSMCAGFISSPWLSQQRRGDLDAKDAATRYGRMAEKAWRWGFSLLSMNCTASQAVMLDEYLGDTEAAVAVVRMAIEVYGRHPVLAHALAKIYWRAKDYDSTLEILSGVAEEVGDGNPVEGAYALRIAAISAAKCGDWIQAERWFFDAQDCATQVQIGDMSVMAIGLGADAAVAAYHTGDVSRAVAGLASAIEALGGVTEDGSLRTAYCHRVVRHTISWLKSRVTGDRVELEGQTLHMEPGMCSNPEPSNAIRDLPLAHIDIAWYLLAEIGVSSRIESGITFDLHDKLQNGPIPMMESILRTHMLEADIDVGDTFQFAEHFAMYLEAAKFVSANVNRLKNIVSSNDRSLDFERGVLPTLGFDGPNDAVVEQAARHSIVAYAMCCVFSAQSFEVVELEGALRDKFPNRIPGEVIFEYWNGNSVEIPALERIVIDLIKKLTQLEYIGPSDLWIAGVRFFEFGNGTMMKNHLVRRIAAWQRTGWRRITTTETFRLLRPRQTVPHISEALGAPEDNDSFLAKLLLTTSEAVGSSLGTKYREHLRAISEENGSSST